MVRIKLYRIRKLFPSAISQEVPLWGWLSTHAASSRTGKADHAMTVFVLGFAFHKNHVALIHKVRGPKPVINKFNGIGGHVEKGETALRAMEREFAEEAGL